jgi:hypothetical protein
MANLEQPDDAPAGKLRRTELQHSASSIPGREILQALTEVFVRYRVGLAHPPGRASGIHRRRDTADGDPEPTRALARASSSRPVRRTTFWTSARLGLGQMLSTDAAEAEKPRPALLDVPRQWCGTWA